MQEEESMFMLYIRLDAVRDPLCILDNYSNGPIICILASTVKLIVSKQFLLSNLAFTSPAELPF